MKLLNLITVADENITMLLTGIRPDGVEIGYDFVNHMWKDNNKYGPEMLIIMKNFMKSNLYHKLRRCEIETFSTMNKNHMTVFRDIPTHRNTVLIIKIHINGNNFEFLKNFEMSRKKPKSTSKPTHKRSFNPKGKDKPHKPEISTVIKDPLVEDFEQSQVMGIPL